MCAGDTKRGKVRLGANEPWLMAEMMGPMMRLIIICEIGVAFAFSFLFSMGCIMYYCASVCVCVGQMMRLVSSAVRWTPGA